MERSASPPASTTTGIQNCTSPRIAAGDNPVAGRLGSTSLIRPPGPRASPGELRREVLGDQLLVERRQRLDVGLGVALGVQVVRVELTNPLQQPMVLLV